MELSLNNQIHVYQNKTTREKIKMGGRAKAWHRAIGYNEVFGKLKACDKFIEVIHFRKPEFFFSSFSHRVVSFHSIVEFQVLNGFEVN